MPILLKFLSMACLVVLLSGCSKVQEKVATTKEREKEYFDSVAACVDGGRHVDTCIWMIHHGYW